MQNCSIYSYTNVGSAYQNNHNSTVISLRYITEAVFPFIRFLFTFEIITQNVKKRTKCESRSLVLNVIWSKYLNRSFPKLIKGDCVIISVRVICWTYPVSTNPLPCMKTWNSVLELASELSANRGLYASPCARYIVKNRNTKCRGYEYKSFSVNIKWHQLDITIQIKVV